MTLFVVTGPIAAGKSTTAEAFALRLRRSGRAVAVLDLDDVVRSIGGFADLTMDRYSQARMVHGSLVGSWLDQGLDVIAHGPFFALGHFNALLHAVPPTTQVHRVRLVVTLDAALERVGQDPTREGSANPTFLRQAHERAEAQMRELPSFDLTLDTTGTTPSEVVDSLWARLGLTPLRHVGLLQQ